MSEDGRFWAVAYREGSVTLPGGGWAFIPDENPQQEPQVDLGPEWVDMGFVNGRG